MTTNRIARFLDSDQKVFDLLPRNGRTNRKIRFTSLDDGTFEVCGLGETLEHVADIALQVAESIGRPVVFTFNGIVVSVTAADIVGEVMNRFNLAWEKRADDYRNSPAGRAAAERRAAEIKDKQDRTDRLLVSLWELVPGDHRAALQWAVDFEDAAGDVGVHFEHMAAVSGLVRLGYVSNEFTVGRDTPKDVHDALRKKLDDSADAGARYIMGQVISCLEGNMPPHPVVRAFVERWMDRHG